VAQAFVGSNPTPRTNSEIWIVTEKSLKIEDQNNIVKENIYDVKGRIGAVTRRIAQRARSIVFGMIGLQVRFRFEL